MYIVCVYVVEHCFGSFSLIKQVQGKYKVSTRQVQGKYK